MSILKDILEDIEIINTNLEEAMNTKIDYTFEKDYEGIYVDFNINNDKITIRFDLYDNIYSDLYEISFTRNNEDRLLNLDRNTFTILGIIRNIIDDFIDIYKPSSFFYAVSDKAKSRLKLYNRLAEYIKNDKKYLYKRSDKILNKKNASFLFYKNEIILNNIINYYKDKN